MQEKNRGLQTINVHAIKIFLDRLVQEENVDDLRAGSQLVLQAKDRFMNVLCRVCGWDDWQMDDVRAMPDPMVDRAVEEIMAHPEKFGV
jgi:hypothetical protein